MCAAAAALSLGGTGCVGPSDHGFYHTVRSGENLYRISLRYGVPTDTLIEVNRIRDVTAIPTGARLWIPRPDARGAPPVPPASVPPERPVSGPLLEWPVDGKLTSRFGQRHGRPHEGIDLSTRRGTPFRAAAAGRVIHAGRLGAYGLTVIVKHAGDYRTVYAHANRLAVKKGAFVERGQRIGEVGTTGNATGPHLHFEVRYRDRPRDPLEFLP
ncbi:MAG: LysM peptidoglycan-binding domain-containing M23 family metallopeptidase [Proteobacteria bacterium]|nr:LysM peptidoglycan-binding domain-containing M23 family metallopeptidase [Pseudomonadota bacterium]